MLSSHHIEIQNPPNVLEDKVKLSGKTINQRDLPEKQNLDCDKQLKKEKWKFSNILIFSRCKQFILMISFALEFVRTCVIYLNILTRPPSLSRLQRGADHDHIATQNLNIQK